MTLFLNNIQKYYSVSFCVISIIIVFAPTHLIMVQLVHLYPSFKVSKFLPWLESDQVLQTKSLDGYLKLQTPMKVQIVLEFVPYIRTMNWFRATVQQQMSFYKASLIFIISLELYNFVNKFDRSSYIFQQSNTFVCKEMLESIIAT